MIESSTTGTIPLPIVTVLFTIASQFAIFIFFNPILCIHFSVRTHCQITPSYRVTYMTS